jgi:hypothetical protein
MAINDTMLNILRKEPKNDVKPEPGSREEKEIKIKTRAGFVINVFALFLAVNTWYGGKLSSTIMNNTIAANDTYAFYQAKSIKQTLAEQSLDDAIERGQKDKIVKLQAKIQNYETGHDGKQELLVKAKALEEERDLAKKRSPWIGYANTAYQLAIVLVSASIISLSMPLFFGSFFVTVLGLALSLQGVFLFF